MLNPLASAHPTHLSSFLSSLLVSPQISLLSSYHLDVPISSRHQSRDITYNPTPLTTLTYLATSILTIQSLSQTLAKKRARDRSVQEPSFGINEHREGVISGFSSVKGAGSETRDVVVEMEIRRRSGRGVIETFILSSSSTKLANKPNNLPQIILLEDHPSFQPPPPITGPTPSQDAEEEEATFSLSLTHKQKRDRENVVLPYFDAQKDNGAHGPGEGGRILYDMGAEDREDFDDEEDEI